VTPEQDALLKKAKESLRAARLLAEQRLNDFAVSRAYYAMFYVAEAFLLGEGSAFSRHAAVISEFGRLFAKTRRVPEEFHRFLIEAQDSRNVGDYDTGPGFSNDHAAEQISRAEEFLKLAERMIGQAKPTKDAD
jgi:uncharacterized protein (UPF0332 family)